MNPLWLVAGVVSPSPSSTTVPEIDPDRVSPGVLGFLAVLFMGVAVFVIWKSLNTQLTRVDFDETATENPRYTRRKARAQAEATARREAQAGTAPDGAAEPPTDA